MNSLVLTGLVSLSCGNMQTVNHRDACSKAIEAAARQSGVYTFVKDREDVLAKNAEDKLKNMLEISTIEIMSSAILVARLGLGYQTSFRKSGCMLGAVCVLQTDTKTHTLTLGWDF